MGTRPSAITWEEGPARLRCGPSSGHALTPNTTHRLDLFTVQFTAIRDHGVDSISQAGSLHVRVLDEHQVLQGDSRAFVSRKETTLKESYHENRRKGVILCFEMDILSLNG